MIDNSKFSLVNLHWKYTTHAYITSSTLVLAALIFIITCVVKDRVKKRRAQKRRRLPSFNSTFRHPQHSYADFEMGVAPYHQATPWAPAPPPPWAPGPPAPGPSTHWTQAPPAPGPGTHWNQAPPRHTTIQGGEVQAPQPLTWSQQPVQAVTHFGPKQIEYQPTIGNISPEYNPLSSNMSPQNEVEVIATINTPPMETEENRDETQADSNWRK